MVVSHPTWVWSLLRILGGDPGVVGKWQAHLGSMRGPNLCTVGSHPANCSELGCQRGTSVSKPPALCEQRMEETSVTATQQSRLSSPLLQGCDHPDCWLEHG